MKHGGVEKRPIARRGSSGVAIVAGVVTFAACGGHPEVIARVCEDQARVDALNQGVDRLVVAADATLEANAVAMAAIAGADVPDVIDDDAVSALCDAASLRIDDAFSDAGDVALALIPGNCAVDHEATFACEAACHAEAGCECEPRSVEARCEPGELRGACDAECLGECRSDPGGTVECTGMCNGRCTGTCEGTCSITADDGSCAGECEGTCSGTCEGGCTVSAGDAVACDGDCKGECSTALGDPACEGELVPACECPAATECVEVCLALGALGATCTTPSIEFTGNLDPAFAATLSEHLPVLLETLQRGELESDRAAELAVAVGELAGLSDECLESGGQALVDRATEAAEAWVSLGVPVHCASARGDATGG